MKEPVCWYVRFVPGPDAVDGDALAGIRENPFFFANFGPLEFLVMPSPTIELSERAVRDDLNHNSPRGRYEVRKATDEEKRRGEGHLHQ